MSERDIAEKRGEEQRLLIELFNLNGYFRDELCGCDLNRMLENINNDMPLFAGTAIDKGDVLAERTKALEECRKRVEALETQLKIAASNTEYILERYYELIFPNALRKLKEEDGEGLTPDEAHALLRKLGGTQMKRVAEPGDGCDAEVSM